MAKPVSGLPPKLMATAKTDAEFLLGAAEHYARRGEYDEALRLIRLALDVLQAEDRGSPNNVSADFEPRS